MNARRLAVVMALGLAATQASATEGRKEQQRSQSSSQGEGKGKEQQTSAGQDPMMRQGPAIKGHASDQTVSGRVASVKEDSVKIEGRGGQAKDLQIAPQTVIDGKVGDASALKEGQQVRASFNEVDGKSVAVEIQSSQGGSSRQPAGGSSKQEPERGSSGSQGSSSSGAGTGTQQRGQQQR